MKKLRGVFAIFLVVLAGCCPPPPEEDFDYSLEPFDKGSILAYSDFSQVEVGQNNLDSLKKLFPGFNTMNRNVTHPYGDSTTMFEGRKVWKLMTHAAPKGSATGSKSKGYFNKKYGSMMMQFKVQLSPGYDYTKGGKLFGMGAMGANGEKPMTGGQRDGTGMEDPKSGYRSNKDGGSARHVYFSDSTIGDYRYDQGMPLDPVEVSYGLSLRDQTFTKILPGKWYTVTKFVANNPLGQSDGKDIWALDGIVRHGSGNVKWIKHEDVAWDVVMFNFFQSAGIAEDQFALFKDIVVWVPDDYPPTQNGSSWEGLAPVWKYENE